MHWGDVEVELLRVGLDPRTCPLRRILTVAWSMVTKEAAYWQVQLLLADCAKGVWAYDAEVEILEELFGTNNPTRLHTTYPATERSKIRRRLLYARSRQHGRLVGNDAW